MKAVLSRIQIYCLLLMLSYAVSANGMFVGDRKTVRVDSLSQKSRGTESKGVVKNKMASSAFPIKVSVRGKVVCVESNNSQILPIYNKNGVFFCIFRLSKGVNWINGLPEGTYFINNNKIVIL